MSEPPRTPTKTLFESKIPSPKLKKESPKYHRRDDEGGGGKLTTNYKQKIVELNSLQEILFTKKCELDRLKMEWNDQELALNRLNLKADTLENELVLKRQKYRLKLLDSGSFGDEKRNVIKRGHSLYVQHLKAEANGQIKKLGIQYEKQLATLKNSNKIEWQKRRDAMLDEVVKLSNQIELNDKNLEEMMDNVLEEYMQQRLQFLDVHQKKWKILAENIESLKSEIKKMTTAYQFALDAQCKVKLKYGNSQKALTEAISEQNQTKKQCVQLKESLQNLQQKSNYYKQKKSTLQQFIDQKKIEIDLLHNQLTESELSRRKLHNEFQELRGAIRVYCRVRPHSNATEQLIIEPFDAENGTQTIRIKDTRNQHHQFAFDKVFSPNETNTDLFNEIQQLVTSSLDGYNVCIFAYGQTGSGKTHTMLKPDDGVVPQTIKYIQQFAKNLSQYGWTYTMELEYIEIYNNKIKDLLPTEKDLPKERQIHEIKHDDKSKTTNVTNTTRYPVPLYSSTCTEIIEQLVEKCNASRTTAATAANNHSSRSHSVFTILLTGTNEKLGETTQAALNLIDLAGSERIYKSSISSAERLKETQNINKSLSSLSKVIQSLHQQQTHVSFRDSKLTYLLKHSLLAGSKTLMLVNISPSQDHIPETINSLRFAAQVNRRNP